MKTLAVLILTLITGCQARSEKVAVPQPVEQAAPAVVTPAVEEPVVKVQFPSVLQVQRDIAPVMEAMVREGMGAHFGKIAITEKKIDDFEKDSCNIVVSFRFGSDTGLFILKYQLVGAGFWKLTGRTTSML